MENMYWIFQNKSTKGSRHWEMTCKLCNNWITEDMDMYFICMNRDKICGIDNFIVCKEEWDEFTCGISQEEVIEKLKMHKKPRRRKYTDLQLERIESFKRSCCEFGYSEFNISKDKRFLNARKVGDSFIARYDIAFDKVSYRSKGKSSLFKDYNNCKIIDSIESRFYEILKGV